MQHLTPDKGKKEEERDIGDTRKVIALGTRKYLHWFKGCNRCELHTAVNKAVRQRSDLLFIAASFWFEESPCAVRTNTAGLGRLCTLFVLSTLLVFEHMHAFNKKI